jgi:hypothetical protein
MLRKKIENFRDPYDFDRLKPDPAKHCPFEEIVDGADTARKGAIDRVSKGSRLTHLLVASLALAEQLLKQSCCSLKALPGEHHRLGLVPWVRDITSFVQARHDVPVETLPRTLAIVEAEIEEAEDGIVNLVLVKDHSLIVTVGTQSR